MIRNINQGQTTKRPARMYGKRALSSGEMRAGSLADAQPEKKAPANYKNGHFKFNPVKRHEHQWLFGEVNKVCSLCGLTQPKDKQ